MRANGLDVATIHPNKGAKYSPNLHAWLTANASQLARHARTASLVEPLFAPEGWMGAPGNGRRRFA